MTAHSPHVALFPGTFDPITNGHLDVVRRGVGLFDKLIVAVANNPSKPAMFTLDERREMIERILADQAVRAEVMCFTGLTVDFARRCGATVILRGLRNVTDLAYEFQLALTNRAVANIETVFVMSGEAYGFTSSTLIKQIAAGGAIERLAPLLPPLVIERMKQKSEFIKQLSRAGDGHQD